MLREIRGAASVGRLNLGGMSGARAPAMLMPSVDRYMTREPYSIASTATLDRGRLLMQRHDIRHLPVVDGDKLVGMICDRDIAVMSALPGVDLSHVEVSRVMSPPVDVWGETPLDEVSELMTKQRTDYVVVRGGQGLEGIFTAVDALVALSDLLRRATS